MSFIWIRYALPAPYEKELAYKSAFGRVTWSFEELPKCSNLKDINNEYMFCSNSPSNARKAHHFMNHVIIDFVEKQGMKVHEACFFL